MKHAIAAAEKTYFFKYMKKTCRIIIRAARPLEVFFPKCYRPKMLSYRRYGENGNKTFVFSGLLVNAAVRGGTCAFTLKIVNTLIKNDRRDDMPSIST